MTSWIINLKYQIGQMKHIKRCKTKNKLYWGFKPKASKWWNSDFRCNQIFLDWITNRSKNVPDFIFLKKNEFRMIWSFFHHKIFHLMNHLISIFYSGFDVIVNCSGMGSQILCHDSDINPIRQQVIRVKANWMKLAIFGDDNIAIVPGLNLYSKASSLNTSF